MNTPRFSGVLTSFLLEILNGYCGNFAMRFEPETIEFLGRTFD
jgi:hypothetical protein